MNLARTDAERLAAFPAELRALLDAELAAGNSIVEIASCFPAPPAGAYVKLARPVSTRARASGDGIRFYDRNSPQYSGEFADAKRFFFILEPPHPPEPEPDMNAIRAGLEARQRAADEARRVAQAREARSQRSAARRVADTDSAPAATPVRAPATRFERFRASMVMDVEKWRDGTGYDLSLLRGASEAERAEIEAHLLQRGVDDWRDVEALAALDTPRARKLLRRTLETGRRELREAVTRYAPSLVEESERAAVLIDLIERGELYHGLTQALAQVREFHPPEVIDALLRAVLHRDAEGGVVHMVGLLMYIHGHAKSDFDWEQRPYYLMFLTGDRGERERLFRDLCARIGADPERFLDGG